VSDQKDSAAKSRYLHYTQTSHEKYEAFCTGYEEGMKMSNQLRAENAELKRELSAWKKDSAAAWDKCEARRIENAELRSIIEEMKNYIIEINDQNNDRCWYNVERLCSEAIASTSAKLEKVGI